MDVETYRTVANVLYVAALIPSVAFVVMYLIVGRWRTSTAGRHLLASTGMLAGLIGLTLLIRAVGAGPSMLSAAALMLVLLVVTMWWRLILLVRNYNKN